MSADTLNKVTELSKDAEIITALALKDPQEANAVVSLRQADSSTKPEIEKRMAEIDITNTNSIIRFGLAAQEELQNISQAMLQGVQNKDIGPAGDSLRDIVTTLRGFSVNELDLRRKASWWEKLIGKAVPLVKFAARFEEVQGQIDKISDDLLSHETILLKDIKSLDLLYDKTLDFYDQLAIYIAAGDAKIDDLDNNTIPQQEADIHASPEDQQILKAQELRDLRAARDDLERRVHDLRLTRQVTMQSLPSIRLVQENDKSLVNKINSTLINTVPLWENQLAQALTIQRSSEAAKAVQDANDLTNELLTKNAANLRESNTMIRREIERGVFDIDAIKQANADLIGTIEESLQIADEGKRKRNAAEADLKKMEIDLRDTLASATSRQKENPNQVA